MGYRRREASRGLVLSGEAPPEEVMDAELSHEGLSGCLPDKGEEVQAKGAVWVHR